MYVQDIESLVGSVNIVSSLDDESDALIRLATYAETVQALHERWAPHPGQERVIRAVFRDMIKFVFIKCGRKFGKTELGIYLLWRWAQTFPNSACYYVAYEKDQAYEIVWKAQGGRLQNFGPQEWITTPIKTEMRLPFRNGSFIKVDGSDNWKQYEGQTPDIIIADEIRLFKREWWETTEPNLAVKNAPIIFMGTPPPDDDGLYNELEKEGRKLEAQGKGLVLHMPSWVNTKIPNLVPWLKDRKERMIARGEEDEWKRQYEAVQARATSLLIFPEFLTKAQPITRNKMDSILTQLRNLEWVIIADPALVSTFGVLLVAYHRFYNRLYIVDEIYEHGPTNCTTSAIWPKIEHKIMLHSQNCNISHSRLSALYDSAETWFAAEVNALGGLSFTPTVKQKNKDINGLPQINEIINSGNLIYCEDCLNFEQEMSKYKKDEKGNIPKKNDHLIDCLRYAVIYLQPAASHRVDVFSNFDEEAEERLMLKRDANDPELLPSNDMWSVMIKRLYRRTPVTYEEKVVLDLEETELVNSILYGD